MTAGALEGLRVVEVGGSTSSAYAGKLLADLGADVVKVEQPGTGDPSRHDGPFHGGVAHPERSGTFLYLNANKRSVAIDIDDDDGLETLVGLCGAADVVVLSSRPSLATARRVPFELLAERNPGLIMATITPHGLTGPYADWHGYDLNTGALGGICGYLGDEGRPLLIPPGSIGELQAGLNAVIPILVSVLAGIEGQHIDISESDCWATVQNGIGIVEYVFGGRLFARRGTAVKSGPYPNAMFHCKDGVIRVMAMQRREWERFLHVIGDPAWADDPRFQDRIKMNELYSDELDAHLEAWMRDKTKEEIFTMCRDAGVPCGPLYTVEDLVEHPELGKLFVEVEHPDAGAVVQAGFPYTLPASPATIRRPAPRLGEHTEEVLREVGMMA